jgi:hypothetical protein
MAQFSTGTGHGSSPPPPPSPQRPSTPTPSTITNPFGDSHAVSALSDIDLSNVDQVEMSRFESEPTGEAAVIMDLQDRDGTVREYVATFPLEAISGQRAHQGGKILPHDNWLAIDTLASRNGYDILMGESRCLWPFRSGW